jgi:hypothetical protein
LQVIRRNPGVYSAWLGNPNTTPGHGIMASPDVCRDHCRYSVLHSCGTIGSLWKNNLECCLQPIAEVKPPDHTFDHHLFLIDPGCFPAFQLFDGCSLDWIRLRSAGIPGSIDRGRVFNLDAGAFDFLTAWNCPEPAECAFVNPAGFLPDTFNTSFHKPVFSGIAF